MQIFVVLIVDVAYGVDALISVMGLPFGSQWVYIEGNTVFVLLEDLENFLSCLF